MRVPGIPYVQGRNDYDDTDGMHYGFAIHNTSNDASDEAEASYATRRTDGISSHFYVDRDSVTQSLDTADNAGHAGSRNGNNHSIAFEFTGGNGMSRQWWLDNIAWAKVSAVMAWIIRNDPDYRGFQVRRATVAEMQANPKVRALYGHDDMRRAWGGTTHTDPGPNFPWDRLISAVNAALGNNDQTEEEDMATPSEIAKATNDFRWDNGKTLYSNARDAASAAAQGRDAVMGLKATVDRLTAALETVLAAGGNVDTATVLARINQLAAEDRARDEAHAREVDELRQRLAAALAGQG